MKNAIVDILHADMVLVGVSLLNQEGGRDAFAREIGAEVTTTELGIGPQVPSEVVTPLQTTVNVARDRISITQAPGRTTIRRDYPSHVHLEEDIKRLTDTATTAIRHSDWKNQQKRAHGFNMSCTFDMGLPHPAVHYIGQKLFQNIFEDRLVGGTARLLFSQEDGQRVTFDLQPRPNNDLQSRILYVGINAHIEGSHMPKPEEISSSLLKLWSQTLSFMERLHANS